MPFLVVEGVTVFRFRCLVVAVLVEADPTPVDVVDVVVTVVGCKNAKLR